jgi:predicted enzyme related to lactoylglutathione lyase
MLSKSKFASLVPIKKMKRAVKFYTETLGGKLIYRDEGEMKDSFASVKVGAAEFWLITPSKKEKRKLAYFTFVVDDIRAEVKQLKKRGLEFEKAERMGPDTKVEGPIAFESFGASAFFSDSEGNALMLWQNVMPS